MPYFSIPHLVQYQGSKRRLATQILRYLPAGCQRLVEPFAGIAAVSLAAAAKYPDLSFHLNDLNAPLINLLKDVIQEPETVIQDYYELWNEQFKYPEHVQHYFMVRDSFNQGNYSPATLLYLLSRCVKGAVRYNSEGLFNQSPDKRRHGAKPELIASNARVISRLLNGRTTFSMLDYREVLNQAKPQDVIYLDPPYQGTSGTKNQRYLSSLSFDELVASLETLERKGIGFILSYDGRCGSTSYGFTLPEDLNCKKILLNAGLSAQATLLGQQAITYEALYLSPHLHQCLPSELFDNCDVESELADCPVLVTKAKHTNIKRRKTLLRERYDKANAS